MDLGKGWRNSSRRGVTPQGWRNRTETIFCLKAVDVVDHDDPIGNYEDGKKQGRAANLYLPNVADNYIKNVADFVESFL